MRLRRMGIDTYRQPVVYMRSDCTICRAEGFEAQSLVEMHVADRSIVALLNIVTTDLLAHQEAGLSAGRHVPEGRCHGERRCLELSKPGQDRC
jgi:thymidine phosphorylase